MKGLYRGGGLLPLAAATAEGVLLHYNKWLRASRDERARSRAKWREVAEITQTIFEWGRLRRALRRRRHWGVLVRVVFEITTPFPLRFTHTRRATRKQPLNCL